MWNARARAVCGSQVGARWGDECGASVWASPAQSDAVMPKHINNVIRYPSRFWVSVLSLREVRAFGYRELVKVQHLAHQVLNQGPLVDNLPLTFASCCLERVWRSVCVTARETLEAFLWHRSSTIVSDKETESGPRWILSINTSAAPDMHTWDHN